jgi:nonribosomal peptide synthetase DhbF
MPNGNTTSFDEGSLPQPLSTQEWLAWKAHQINPRNPELTKVYCCAVSGPLNVTLFAHSIYEVVSGSEVLHRKFLWTSQGPLCCLEKNLRWIFAFINVGQETNPYSHATAWMLDDSTRYVDITEGPLFTIALLRLADDYHIYYSRFHQIVSHSLDIASFRSRIFSLYDALFTKDASSNFHRHPVLSIKDFSLWEKLGREQCG